MTALCHGRDPELWSTGDDGNRLALLICARCTGCPDTDPNPAGVIRQGVAYSDTGFALPVCGDCGYPVVGYNGGTPSCRRCADPQVWVADRTWLRRRRVTVLAGKGLLDRQISDRTGIPAKSVSRIRRDLGIAKRFGPAIGSRQAAGVAA